MATLYTVSQAARILDTSTATVRRIADEMADILPDYQPAPGQARKFTDNDLRTLSALHTRLQASPGTTRTELAEQLSRPDSEPLVIPDTIPAAKPAKPQESPGTAKTPAPIQTTSPLPENALQPFLTARNETDRKIDALSARIEQLSADRPATGQPSRPDSQRLAIAIALSFGLLLGGVAGSVLFQTSQAALITSVLALLVMGFTLIWPTIRR